jgi:hypothetical protein
MAVRLSALGAGLPVHPGRFLILISRHLGTKLKSESSQNGTKRLTFQKQTQKLNFVHLMLEQNVTVRLRVLFLQTSKVGSADKVNNMVPGNLISDMAHKRIRKVP